MGKKRIMIIEDEIITAKSIASELEKSGYIISSIQTMGEEAIALAINEKPDIILMDIIIHGNMDGIEVAEKILSNVHIPIIYMTGYSDNETMKRAKKTKPVDYLVKPIDLDRLKHVIASALIGSKL